jgi:hypothetical protein
MNTTVDAITTGIYRLSARPSRQRVGHAAPDPCSAWRCPLTLWSEESRTGWTVERAEEHGVGRDQGRHRACQRADSPTGSEGTQEAVSLLAALLPQLPSRLPREV